LHDFSGVLTTLQCFYNILMNEKEFLIRFGKNLKIQRIKKEYTQEQLAEIVDMHEKHIGKIETGCQNVTLKTVYRLASALF